MVFRVETWSTGGSTRGINHGDGKDRGSKSRRVSLGRKAHGAGTGTGKGPWPPLCEGRGAVGRKEVGTVAVPSLSRVRLFATLWTAAHQASLSFTVSQKLLKLMSIELMTPPNHLILCCPLLLLHSIFLIIRVFFNESALRTRWPNYGSFSFSISPSNVYSGFISFRIDWFDLLAVQHSCLSPYQKVLDKDSSADIQSWGTALTFLRCSFFLKNKWKGFFDSRNV